jgi:hypothetical protein
MVEYPEIKIMTEAAKKYFELYYKLQRCIDEGEKDGLLANKTRKELYRIYNEMTEKEQQLLDIVGIEHGKT